MTPEQYPPVFAQPAPVPTYPPVVLQPEPEEKHPSKRTIIIAVLLVAILSVGIVGAVILSNTLTIGPYNAETAPITISQVTSPAFNPTPCSASNSGAEANYQAAVELPTGSGSLTQAIWYRTGIEVNAPHGSSFSVTELFNITYTGSGLPVNTDIQLLFCNRSNNLWTPITTTFNPADPVTTDTHYRLASWTGSVTGTSFILPSSYDVTTPLLLTVLQSGTYNAALWFST